jgi:hypothetical protein
MDLTALRTEKPLRYRRARSDGSVKALAASIESERGLPTGSVRIVGPDGRKIRSDASVAALRKRWGDNI